MLGIKAELLRNKRQLVIPFAAMASSATGVQWLWSVAVLCGDSVGASDSGGLFSMTE